MPRYLAFNEPPEPRRLGILLVNLGTPDAPTTSAVRRYLAEFLWDPRIIEQPRWLWWLILHGIILRIRPARSARAYRKVWTEDGSPLQSGTLALANAMQKTMPGRVKVRHAMRYGNPSIAEALKELAEGGMQRLLVLPLFPQFSATTAASVLDALGTELREWRCPPELRFINDYHDDPAHIDALARSVERHWKANGRGERLLLSFHGIPERYVRNGDPYRAQCEATAALLRERLGMDRESLIVCFQSRVGREPWLSPYTDKMLDALPAQGVKRIDVICPGFSIDCLETLEEIAIEGRRRFLAAGGERFDYIPSLNDSDEQVSSLRGLLLRHCQGWPDCVDPLQSMLPDVPVR